MYPWEACVRKVTPYVPGEQPFEESKIIKLNTNENPYPPSPEVMKAAECIKWKDMRLYPDYRARELVKAISLVHGVGEDMIFPGVGSDDVLSMIFMTFFGSSKPILFPDVSYSFYSVWAEVYKIPYEKVPVGEDFTINPEDYYRDNGGVVFPNPNAPTSLALEIGGVRDILEHNRDVICVVDEAYIDFGGTSALELLDEFPNLIVVRTFSKSKSLAGLRVGYAIAAPEIIKYLNDVKYSVNSYTLNTPSIEVGAAAMLSGKYYATQTEHVVLTREAAYPILAELGFETLKSSTNFLFTKHERLSGKEIYDGLRARGVYVRHFNAPRIDDYLRITIGSEYNMGFMYDVLRDIINGHDNA